MVERNKIAGQVGETGAGAREAWGGKGSRPILPHLPRLFSSCPPSENLGPARVRLGSYVVLHMSRTQGSCEARHLT